MAVEQIARPWQAMRPVATPDRSDASQPAKTRRRPAIPLSAVVGLMTTTLIVLAAIAGPLLFSVDPAKQDLIGRLLPPFGFGGTLEHPLGTDALGRDLLARVLAGARLSLAVGLIATAVAGSVGVTLGLLAGFGGGLADRLVTWCTDVQMAVPFVIVAISLTAVLGNGILNVLVALAVTGWVGYARVLRLQARALKSAPWVEAARSVGAGPGRIAIRHILPNLLGTIAVLATQQVAGMILYEAALSYLGLGIGGNAITWGGIVAGGQEVMLKAWWVPVIPGIALAVTVLALNAVGDWLTDARRHV